MAYSGAYSGLRMVKTLLFNLFWAQLAFLLLAWAIYALGKDTLYPWLLAQSGIRMTPETLNTTILIFFGVGKFILYCVYLVPAIALHWTIRKLERNSP